MTWEGIRSRSKVFIICHNCQKPFDKPAGQVNRSRVRGHRIFCSRKCSGLAKRHNKTLTQKKLEKRLYDMEYRANNAEKLRQRHHEYHVRTYDPIMAAIVRKKNMPRHIEYCRRPEYKVYKKYYDKVHRSERLYGDFAGVAMLLQDLKSEIKERMSHDEIIQANDTYNKRQYRVRAAGQAARHKTRPRDRRSDDRTAS